MNQLTDTSEDESTVTEEEAAEEPKTTKTRIQIATRKAPKNNHVQQASLPPARWGNDLGSLNNHDYLMFGKSDKGRELCKENKQASY